jgi:predicted nucleotidyltransferase
VTELEDQLRAITSALDTRRIPFALVDGLAVAVRAEPRLTRDADLAVSVDGDAAAESLILDLRSDGYTPFAAVEHEVTGRLATIRLRRHTDVDGTVTDLLFASSGVEPEIVAGAEPIDILPDLRLPVATVGHLIVMKLLARDDRGRPADADDLVALAAIATPADWTTATDAAHLVVERGYGRGRPLPTLVQNLRVIERPE